MSKLMPNTSVYLKLTHPTDPELQSKAEWFCQQPGLDCHYLDRPSRANHPEQPPKDQLREEALTIPVLHITRKGVFAEHADFPGSADKRFSFHPSMALLRLIEINRGGTDRFLSAIAIQPGDQFLDATLGLGTDALVAASQVGEGGRVLAIEHSPLLAALVRDGLATLSRKFNPGTHNPEKDRAWCALAEAAQRIEVLWGDHAKILSQLPADSFDIIYFDPMFRRTCEESASIRPLHHFSNPEPLAQEAITEADRVARKRVVLKERKGSGEFTRLGFTVTAGGKYSEVDYGIIHRSREGRS
jgi:16S rRNA G966 N2-methylase RsmD